MAPTDKLRALHAVTAKNLKSNIDAHFATEGKPCAPRNDGTGCPDGCLRWVWNSQLHYVNDSGCVFKAQRNRCSVSSKVAYTETNVVVNKSAQ